MKENNSHICYHPWVGLEINAQREFKPCCLYPNSIADNLSDYQNSEELLDLRQSFLNGEKPAKCKTCWDRELAGLPSKRLTDWEYVFHRQVPNLDSLKVLMFDFGNACNLACRICSSKYSSTWINEERRLKEHFPNIKIYNHQKFYQDKTFMDQIKEASTDLIQLHVLGGEPFVAGLDDHLDFLKFLSDHDGKNTELHYITNGTVFPKKEFLDVWKNFKRVNIQVSIDGVGLQFEYNRWPAKWNKLVENIQLYREQGSSIKLTVSHTVSTINVYYLPELYKWLLQNKITDPFINTVDEPSYYNIKAFPKTVKDKIAEKLKIYKFDEIVAYMYEEDYSSQFNETIRITKILDQQRNQSYSEVYPEFSQILKEAGCQI